jgi:leucyl-tRNA synthetase
VLHLLYSRFWHKFLYDIGHGLRRPSRSCGSVNQGLILGEMEFHAFETSEALQVSASEIRDIDEEATENGVSRLRIRQEERPARDRQARQRDDVEQTKAGFPPQGATGSRVDAAASRCPRAAATSPTPTISSRLRLDALRLYVMYMGPLEQQKPWNTRDIVGMSRFLNSVWRNLIGDDEEPSAKRQSRRQNRRRFPRRSTA